MNFVCYKRTFENKTKYASGVILKIILMSFEIWHVNRI